MKIGQIVLSKSKISCLTGSCEKGDPLQVIRIRDNNTIDMVNLKNELIYKIPQGLVSEI